MLQSTVALHPEGVDRNKNYYNSKGLMDVVALHPEGVDRNHGLCNSDAVRLVALHPEGVDRNSACFVHSKIV